MSEGLDQELINSVQAFEIECEELINHLPETDCEFRTADEYAVKFLKGSMRINSILKKLRNFRINLKQQSKIAYSLAFQNAGSTKVTEKNKMADRDGNFLAWEKCKEENENRIKYFKGLFEVFRDAHIYYKNYARDK